MERYAKQTTLVLMSHKHKNTYADKSQKNSADQVEMLLLIKALELQAKQNSDVLIIWSQNSWV